MHLHTVVVGGGTAGLAVSYNLAKLGIEHTVLEKGDIGESWKNHRWDSFSLNTTNQSSVLPGDENTLPDPDAFMSRDEFVEYLQSYVTRNDLPVQTGVHVSKVRKNSNDIYEIETSNGAMTADNIVVASGSQNIPKLPKLSSKIPGSILQLHSDQYKRSDALPEGATLVIGSGQSGVQIVEDLLDAGRKVYLATSKVGRVVRRYRGRDMVNWAKDNGFYEHTIQDLEDPRMAYGAQPQTSGTKGGHTVSLQSIEKLGAVLLGRLNGYENGKLTFADNLSENIIFADTVSAKLTGMVEGYIIKAGIDAVPAEVDEADIPYVDAESVKAPAELDPAEVNITSIIWCTGFGGDFSWIEGVELDERGIPVHEKGTSPNKGLYYIGFQWISKRKSGLIDGVTEDAENITQQVKGTE